MATNPVDYLEDSEDEIQRLGNPQTESVVAGTRKKAVERCLEEAKGRKLLAVQLAVYFPRRRR